MTPTKLRHIRKTLGWTQERLAEETDYTRGYINNMEKGTPGFDITQVFIDALIAAVIRHVKIIRKIVK